MRWITILPLAFVVACSGSAEREQTSSAPAQTSVAPSAEPEETGSTLIEGSLHSAALGVEKNYVAYLPAGYAATKTPYPVIYMLHGLGGNEGNWTEHFGLKEAADALALEAIVVMPDGDDSFYVNWSSATEYDACLEGSRGFGRETEMSTYCVRTPRYGDYIANDLVRHIDGEFRTVKTREARAIGGVSMGGYGALKTAFSHTDLFSSVTSHSGIASLLYSEPHPYKRGAVELTTDPGPWIDRSGALGAQFERVFGRGIEGWKKNDPVHLAPDLKKGELAIYMDCGTDDEFELDDGAAHLAEVLTGLGLEHSLELLPGHHNPAFFKTRIDDGLAFHAEHFARGGE